ncbi:alginate export family protein [Gemmatimonas sp.]|uniref:alginate export family protein n=1 Tax=Gemmatimonas sp. TaxID=1962908 RepID=UPI00286E8B24|nr:alginate export family protein [Gemmatimonas sp.]
MACRVPFPRAVVGALLLAAATLRAQSTPTAAAATAHTWSDRLKKIPLYEGWPLTLTLSGQARWREEFMRGYNVGTLHDDYGFTRLMVGLDVQAGQSKGLHGRVLAELRDAQALSRTLPGGTRTTDGDRHDIQNLYADIGYGRSFVRYGRQEVSLNRERLVGVPDWANTRRGSEGTRAQLVRGRLVLEGADIRPMIVRLDRGNRPDSTARLRTLSLGSATGASRFARGVPTQWNGYWYEQTIRTSSSFTRRLTTGARTLWQFGTPAASRLVTAMELEGAVQRGHAGTRELQAWFWVAEAQLQWRRVRGTPSLALGLEEASSDRPATPGNEAFAVLYPAAHQHGGFADVIGRPNVTEVHAISSWDPLPSLSLRGAWYRFDRRRLDDGVYNKQNALFRAASGSTARHVADEVDLTAAWKATTHLRVLVGGATVLPGAFLSSTPGGAHVEHWGYLGTTFAF